MNAKNTTILFIGVIIILMAIYFVIVPINTIDTHMSMLKSKLPSNIAFLAGAEKNNDIFPALKGPYGKVIAYRFHGIVAEIGRAHV
jgi:hypothetical protein